MLRSFIVCVAILSLSTSIPAQDAAFRPLFNGKDLAGWDGQEGFWRVVDGVVEGAPEKDGDPIPSSTFLVYKASKVGDFHLKLQCRISTGNSGIQYRSINPHKHSVRGYQAEISPGVIATGFLHMEGRRGMPARVGESVINGPQGKGTLIGQVFEAPVLMKEKYYKPGEWTDYDVVVRGNHHLHFINNYPTVEYLERDVVEQDLKRPGRLDEGLLALQLHSGKYMKVEFRDVKMQTFPYKFGDAERLFNDADLSGWKPRPADAWTVNAAKGYKSLIARPAAAGDAVLTTDKTFDNFIVRLQVRDAGKNAGIALRGDAKSTQPLVSAKDRPKGQWNDYEFRVVDGVVDATINNQPAGGSKLPSSSGTIALHADAGEFRNVVLIPIRKLNPAP